MLAIIAAIVGISSGIITLYWFFFLRPRELKQQDEKLKRMVSVPSPLQDGVTEFVPKDEFEFGKLTEKADSLFHKGDFSEAESLYIKAYEQAMSTRKGQLIALALLGIGAAKGMQGNYDAAIKKFNQTLKFKNKIKDKELIGRILDSIGVCYYLVCNYNKAIKNYNQAIEVNPMHAKAFSNRGVAYTYKGELDKAIADFNQAIKLDPKLAGVYINRGNVYSDKSELDRAIADYNITINLNPKETGAFNNRGIVYSHKGELDNAIADYTRAIKLDPKFTEAFYNRGEAYYDKGELDKAITDFNQAVLFQHILDKLVKIDFTLLGLCSN